MARLLLVLGLCCCLTPLLAVAHADDGFDVNKQRRELASEYRLRRAQFKAPAGYNEAAKNRLSEIEALYKHGEYKVARKLAERSYKSDFPYSTYAAHFLHAHIKGFLPRYLPAELKHKIYAARIHARLSDLWLRFPDYEGMRMAFDDVLEAAEIIRTTGTVIDVHAETIQEAIKREWGLHLNAALDLFTFLETNGDKHNIAPRASMGIARIYLIQGTSDPRKLFMARAKYRQFIARYSTHELVFDALIERAYSHLIAYRGDKYDVGVLIEASYILKQAELYTKENKKNIDLVARLRGLIRRSFQARDFQVAAWYQEKGHQDPAIYYYNEVVKRDPNSNIAKDAQRILNDFDNAEKAPQREQE